MAFLYCCMGIIFFVLLFCSFFSISFPGVIGLLLQFVFYIIDFFAVFVLFVDCAFYSWIILIVSVFCNGICWLIMVFVNFWAFYCLNEKLLFLLMLPLEWESVMSCDWVVVYKYLKILMDRWFHCMCLVLCKGVEETFHILLKSESLKLRQCLSHFVIIWFVCLHICFLCWWWK